MKVLWAIVVVFLVLVSWPLLVIFLLVTWAVNRSARTSQQAADNAALPEAEKERRFAARKPLTERQQWKAARRRGRKL